MKKLTIVFLFLSVVVFSQTTTRIRFKELNVLPTTGVVGDIIVYDDTLRTYTGASWVELGSGGSSGDPHITDSSLFIGDYENGSFSVTTDTGNMGRFQYYWTNKDNSQDYTFRVDTMLRYSLKQGDKYYSFNFDTSGFYYTSDIASDQWTDNHLVTKGYVDTLKQTVSATLGSSFQFNHYLTNYGRDTIATTKTITINTTGAAYGNMIYWWVYGGTITINGGVGDTFIVNTAKYAEIMGRYNGFNYIFKCNRP